MNTSETSAKTRIHRRFLKVGNRRMHYLRAGEGPPALLVHSSPANVTILLPEIAHLSTRFTCIAFDTPSFGLSDPLQLEEMEVADLADALAEAMDVLGLPPCPVFGSHTGAAIALELTARHPEKVTGTVLDGVPIYMNEESKSLVSKYFQTMPFDEFGGHYARTWTRFRDQSIWFPWFARHPDNLNHYDLSPPERTHEWVMMYFYAAHTYAPAYRAALSYGERALDAVAAINGPMIFTATETDMLHPHLARLPALKPGQEIQGIGSSLERKRALTEKSFIQFGSAGAAPHDDCELRSSTLVERQFVDGEHGEIHVRYAGQRTSPPLLLLHDAPGSAQFLGPLIEALSTRYFVCAPDLPGCGESDPLPGDAATISEFARALEQFCEKNGFKQPLVYGIGFGSSAAIALAQQLEGRIAGLLLRGVLLPDVSERQALRKDYAPPIAIQQDGSHWYRTWLMLRDSLIYWPWYNRRYNATRPAPGDFDGERMHAWTFDVMKQHTSYQHLIHAAIDFETDKALAELKCAVILINDPHTPFSVYDEHLNSLLPQAPRCLATDDSTHALTITNLLAHQG